MGGRRRAEDTRCRPGLAAGRAAGHHHSGRRRGPSGTCNRSIPGALKNAVDWAIRPWGSNSFAQVVGLASTGSKDVVKDAFVPDQRTLDAREVSEGILAERNRPGNPLYAMPFGVLFSSAISAAALGIAEGAHLPHS